MRSDSIYYQARVQAAKRDRLFANRERAAAALHISAEALMDYETGRTLPRCDVVQWMVDVYAAPWLKGAHMREACPLMTEGVAECSKLERAALGWLTAISSAESVGRDFAALAVDGRITRDEIVTARAIRAKAVELTRLMQETIAAIDTALVEGGADDDA